MSVNMPLVERFGKVVEATEAVVLPYLKGLDATIEQIHYLYGHPLSIINTLNQMNDPQEYQFKKYPLIALFMDFGEDTSRAIGSLTISKPQIVIATQTTTGRSTDARYTDIIKPILRVIYEELVRQIIKSPYFFNTRLPHTMLDRPFWGKEGLYGNYSGIANDYLDAVEIRNPELVTGRQRNCVTPAPIKNF